MLPILYKYFVINRKAVLPGIGIFRMRRQPASFDFANKVFISPSAHIVFTESNAVPETSFYSFVSKEQQIDEAGAVKHFAGFAAGLKEDLQINNMVELAGFGLLTKDGSGALQFQPVEQLPSLFQNVTAESPMKEVPETRVIVPQSETEDNEVTEVVNEELQIPEKQRSYWWVYAIIIAAISIAAIIYYYSQNAKF